MLMAENGPAKDSGLIIPRNLSGLLRLSNPSDAEVAIYILGTLKAHWLYLLLLLRL